MKRTIYLFLSIFIFLSTISPISLVHAQANGNSGSQVTTNDDGDESWDYADKEGQPESWLFLTPTSMVDSIYWNANKKQSNQVQYTEYDVITSKVDLCATWTDGRFTITRTLCNLRELSKDYLQYVMYIGLTAATILLIRNWFKIVTSTDREKQITTFKKNITYIIIWVFLLIWFYYIIDLLVALVNLLTK